MIKGSLYQEIGLPPPSHLPVPPAYLFNAHAFGNIIDGQPCLVESGACPRLTLRSPYPLDPGVEYLLAGHSAGEGNPVFVVTGVVSAVSVPEKCDGVSLCVDAWILDIAADGSAKLMWGSGLVARCPANTFEFASVVQDMKYYALSEKASANALSVSFHPQSATSAGPNFTTVPLLGLEFFKTAIAHVGVGDSEWVEKYWKLYPIKAVSDRMYKLSWPPPSKQNGLSCKIEIPESARIQNDELDAEFVLKNTSKQPIRVDTLCMGWRGTDQQQRLFTIELDPEHWKSAQPMLGQKKDLVTLQPGESVSIPFKIFLQGSNPVRVIASYVISKKFADKYNLWEGEISAQPLIITPNAE